MNPLACKLSICIPTLNRGSCIGETLDSIVSQLEDGVEIVIVDGGSTDNTEQVVASYRSQFPSIHFETKETSKGQPSNEGFDRDCNHAVEIASGEYCWLMTDDDLLRSGAISKALSETRKGYPVIVASAEIRNKDLSNVLVARCPELPQDQIYQPNEWGAFVAKVGHHLSFVGAVIVNRQFWLSRDRQKYFGSGFIHVGVIFDRRIDEDVLVIADPLVSIRYGHGHWTNRAFQIWMFTWPELIWSFSTISDEAKKMVVSKEPWRRLRSLLMLRAQGTYSIGQYQTFLCHRLHSKIHRLLAELIARLPRMILYIPAYVYLYLRGARCAVALFDLRNTWHTVRTNL
jgi:abequosyltransferase